MNHITLKFFIKPHLILNITKLLVKISQFKFLVVTEKNIFVYKPYLSLNNSDFTLFFNVKTAGPLKKGHPALSQQPPLNPVKLPLFERLVGGSTSPAESKWWPCAKVKEFKSTHDWQVRLLTQTDTNWFWLIFAWFCMIPSPDCFLGSFCWGAGGFCSVLVSSCFNAYEENMGILCDINILPLWDF